MTHTHTVSHIHTHPTFISTCLPGTERGRSLAGLITRPQPARGVGTPCPGRRRQVCPGQTASQDANLGWDFPRAERAPLPCQPRDGKPGQLLVPHGPLWGLAPGALLSDPASPGDTVVLVSKTSVQRPGSPSQEAKRLQAPEAPATQSRLVLAPRGALTSLVCVSSQLGACSQGQACPSRLCTPGPLASKPWTQKQVNLTTLYARCPLQLGTHAWPLTNWAVPSRPRTQEQA